MKKRFLACLLALCLLVCGGLPMGASAIEIADSTILAQHFQLDGSGEFTKETFSSTTSHHLTPGSFGDISIEDNSTANLYVESTDMSELEFGVPILMLAPGDRDHILSGVFNQFLSALTEPVE